ncbi:MAG: hypothetical protein Q6M54_06145 [Thermostichus sp. DRC_bins_24]
MRSPHGLGFMDPVTPFSPVRRFRPLATLALTVGILTGLGVGGYVLLQQLRLQLHRDLINYRYTAFSAFGYGDSEGFEPGQTDRWFPLTYPVLARWGESADPVRSSYAFQTLQGHGLPYSRWWLEDRLRQNPAQFFTPAALFGGYDYSSGQVVAPRYELFGLDRPESVTRLTELALAGIQADSPDWSFNLNWLNSLLTQEAFPFRDRVYGVLLPALQSSPPARAEKLLSALPYGEEGIPTWALSEVRAVRERVLDGGASSPYIDFYARADQVLALEQPTVQRVRPLYEDLPPSSREFFLLQIADPETLNPAAQVLLRSVVADEADPQRVLAAALLYLKGDPTGEPLLQVALNEEFGFLYGIGDYLVLLQLAEAFPNSRFTRACQEYAQIRGGSYFGHFPYDFETGERISRPFPPAEEEARWRTWLATYPDHPGADDAFFWLTRTLEWQGKRKEALTHLADWVVGPFGDGDMRYSLRSRLLLLLDTGTSRSDLETFLSDHSDHPLATAVRYALAVRHAREHRYDQALQLTENLSLDALLDRYPLLDGSYWLSDWDPEAGTRPRLDPELQGQRERWRKLSRWQNQSTPQQRYQLAAHWASFQGWRNGYLWLFNQTRAASLNWDPLQPPPPEATSSLTDHQRANHHAVAAQLFGSLLQDPATPADVQEKSLYWQVVILYRQYTSYPPGETEAIHPLPGFPAAIGEDASLFNTPLPDYVDPGSPGYRYFLEAKALQNWYARQAIQAGNELLARFPRSRYAGDVLMSLYGLTVDITFLERLLAQFPDSERALEAEYALGLNAY